MTGSICRRCWFLSSCKNSTSSFTFWRYSKDLANFFIVSRGFLTPHFMKTPLHYLPPLFKFCPTYSPPLNFQPTALFVTLFLRLDRWSHHIWCVILLKRYYGSICMSNLRISVPKGPRCVSCNNASRLLMSGP